MLVMMAAVLVLLPVLIILVFKLSKGRTRRIAKRVNLAAGILAGVLVIAAMIISRINTNDGHKYTVHGAGIFGGITYDRTEDGYYIFKQSRFLSPAEELAVSEDVDSLPLLAKLSVPVLIYTDGAEQKETVELSSGKCACWTNVVKLNSYPYFEIILIIMLILMLLNAFNLVILMYIGFGSKEDVPSDTRDN